MDVISGALPCASLPQKNNYPIITHYALICLDFLQKNLGILMYFIGYMFIYEFQYKKLNTFIFLRPLKTIFMITWPIFLNTDTFFNAFFLWFSAQESKTPEQSVFFEVINFVLPNTIVRPMPNRHTAAPGGYFIRRPASSFSRAKPAQYARST